MDAHANRDDVLNSRHTCGPRWIVAWLKCRHCKKIALSVFPEHCKSLECTCGKWTAVHYVRRPTKRP